MSLELYHLELSQSERLVWLFEEMQIPYTLKLFKRNPQTALAPDELKAIVSSLVIGLAPYSIPNSLSEPDRHSPILPGYSSVPSGGPFGIHGYCHVRPQRLWHERGGDSHGSHPG